MQRWDLPREPVPESSVQTQMKSGLVLCRFHVLDFSQGRETRQSPGVPDCCAIHPEWHVVAWIEVKRPYIKGIQTQGKLSWEQENLHGILRTARQNVVTIDQPDEALAYFAYLGYPVPRDMYREPFSPEAQSRFHDPRARPMVVRTKRKSGRRWTPAIQSTMHRLLNQGGDSTTATQK